MYLKKTHKGMLSPFAGSSKHKRKYTDTQIKDMRDRILAGESYRSVGRSYGISGAAIKANIQRHNPIIINKMIPKDYISIYDFAETIGLSVNGLYYHIQSKKIPTVKVENKLYIHKNTVINNHSLTLDDEKVEAIYILHTKKWSMTKIAVALSINRATVSTYIKLKDYFK